MAHKAHLEKNGGAYCQRGRVGGDLRGEHFTFSYAEFAAMPVAQRCEKCNGSKLFAFLTKQADAAKPVADEWVPEDQDAWKAADAALIASRRKR